QHLKQANFIFNKKTLLSFHFYPFPSLLLPEETKYTPRKEAKISHLSLNDLTCRELQFFKALSKMILGTSICSQIMRIFCFPSCLLFYTIYNLFSEIRFLALAFLN
ncbi:hypothetical protein GIB67_042828, partial [Kingdonia uniflora]